MTREPMNHEAKCPRCGASHPLGFPPGLCPACLLTAAARPAPNQEMSEPTTPPVRIFGDYELLREIGRGGMGVVYQARQISLNRTVALKMILSGPFASPETLQRFRAEAEAAANLRQIHIVTIYDYGEQDGMPYYSMEYVEGKSLAQEIASLKSPSRDFRQTANLMRTITRAVHYAHQQGVLHRDLKPSNVILDDQGEPRITDFGLAKRLEADASLAAGHSSVSLRGQVLGSPNYMPPEQATGGRVAVGPWSDVYSLGAILFQLLTGRPPFVGSTITEVLQQVTQAEPVTPRKLNPTVPRDLETMCLKCLEKDPLRRYRSAQELADELDRFLSDEPIRARPVGWAGQLGRWCRRKPAIASLTGGLVLVFAAGLIGVLWQWRQAQANALFARQNAYAADMNVAHRALQEHDLGRALELLNNYRPNRGGKSAIRNPKSETDLRGWEWRYLWQLCQSDEQFTLGRYTNMVGTLALSPDGKWLAVRQGEKIALWDLAARREVAAWPCHGYRRALAFSYDSSLLAVVSDTPVNVGPACMVSLWQTSTRREVEQLGHPEAVAYLVFSRDGKLATYDYLGMIRLWDIESRQVIATNQVLRLLSSVQRSGYGLDDGRGTLAFSGDGTVLAIGEFTGQIQLWEWATGKKQVIPTPVAGEGVTTLAFSPDGKMLAAGYGYSDSKVRLWDVRTLTNAGELVGHKAWVSALAFAPGGNLVSASGDQTLRLWDVPQRKELKTLKGHTLEVWSVVVSPDGAQILSGSKDGSIRVWDLTVTPSKTSPITLPEPVWRLGLAFSPDSQTLFTTMDYNAPIPGLIKAWDPLTGQVKRQFAALGTQNCSVAISPDGQLLAAGNLEGVVKVWDIVKDRAVTNFVAHTNSQAWWCLIVGLAFDQQSQRLLTVGWKYVTTDVAEWEVSSWRKLRSGPTDRSVVMSWDFSSDHRWIACGHLNGTISVWDLSTGTELASFQGGLPTTVKGVAFLSGGAVLAAGGHDGLIRLWNVAQRRQLATLQGQMSAVHYLSVSPDGRRLASGGSQPSEAIRLWDLAIRKDLLTLEGQGSLFGYIGFSPDGNILVAVNDQMIVHLWHAPSWAEIEAAEKLALPSQ